MKRLKHIALSACLVFASCKSIKPDRPPAATSPAPPSILSTINIPIEIPLGLIEQRLNTLPESKLFQEQDLPLGSGLTADLDVDRSGAIELEGMENGSLQVRIPMRARGILKIEKRVFGQVLSTDFPFDERIAPQFSFCPHVEENWDLQIKDLEIENWGKSLRYNLLGFEIDLEPLLRRQVQRVLDSQLTASNLQQLDFRELAQTAWSASHRNHSMEIEGISMNFSTEPIAIKLSQEIGADQTLRLYVGLEGNIKSTIGNSAAKEPKPLPKLSLNENKVNNLSLIMPLVIPYAELELFLNRSLAGKTIRLDNKTSLVPSNLRTSRYGDKTLLEMDFKATRKSKKEIVGKMYFAGIPEVDPEANTLQFGKPQFDVKSDDFFSDLAIRLRKGKIQRQIRKNASIPIGPFLQETQQYLEQNANWDLGFASIEVVESSLAVDGIYQSDKDIQVYLVGKGKTSITIKK